MWHINRHYQAAMADTGDTAISDTEGNSVGPLGVAPLLLCRFVDRDGDGMISADDIFTTHALITQKSAVWTRVRTIRHNMLL